MKVDRGVVVTDALGIERATVRAVVVVAARAAAFEKDDDVARGLGEIDEVLVLRAVGADRTFGLELQPLAVGRWDEGVVRGVVVHGGGGVPASSAREGEQENQGTTREYISV